MFPRRHIAAAIAVCVPALVAPGTAAMSATSISLYSGPGPRPGPDILYGPLAQAPQLSNAPGSVWTASPILVSGTTAYRDGEFLYQGFLYDDHGANSGIADPNDPRSHPGGSYTSSDDFSAPNGTYTYPTAAVYAGNAANLVELRVKPLADATAFRITLNTMKDPALVATTIAIGDSAVPRPYPRGANTKGPAQLFLTVHGSEADLLDATTGATVGHPSVSIDMLRRQIEVRVPHAGWEPRRSSVRLAAAVGLWDVSAGRYLVPQFSADATHPGGAGVLSNPSAFFDVAPRTAEPMPTVDPTSSRAASYPAWWRDSQQGAALRSGDVSPFFADVDFGKLASGIDDESGVPVSGPMDRILASHFETEQGLDTSSACLSSVSCQGVFRGRLQPYAIYVPKRPAPPSGYGLTLLLHSLGTNYNQYLASRNQSQLGERGTGSIVITPEGRGTDGFYYDTAGADTFEVWADVAARYHLDPDWTAISGYSMGGYGTFKLAAQYPDLFARAQPVVGPPDLGLWVPPLPVLGGPDDANTFHMVESLRNVPFMMWVETTDELVPYPGTLAQARRFDALGYRYVFRSYLAGDHLALAINDEYQPAADFLGEARVDRNPAHVTYVVNPTMDFPAVDTVAAHAYWLSGLPVRDPKTAYHGIVDVRSEGFGTGDPAPSGTQFSAGILTGGTLGAIPYHEEQQTWGPIPTTAVADRLDITATNISAMTIDVVRAHVDCNVALSVKSDGPLLVTLAGCKGQVATITPSSGTAAATTATLPNTGRGTKGGAASVVALAIAAAGLVTRQMRRSPSTRRIAASTSRGWGRAFGPRCRLFRGTG